ncbi:MAG: class I adenylate cyclase [Deltaproteobacteria bacterium]|nr:class I adenylate cyclase [Deltaproteobacteria bacterium]
MTKTPFIYILFLIMSELIFPETIPPSAYNARLPLVSLNNRARIRDLRTLATPGFRRTFDLIPTLLHHNHADLPGYSPDPQTPHGLVYYDIWLKRGQLTEKGPWATGRPVERPVVECLVLIGSSGSVGQTSRSDLDYWVCYDPARLNGLSLDLFRAKLAAISHWAMTENQTEANFYPMDLAVLAEGRLNSLSEERDGEVAPMLLIEELYRTILYVAGRFPLWLVFPTDGTAAEYLAAASELAPLSWTESPPFYVDFGFPVKPQPQEYLASAMWLTCKSEADPFKGLFKIMPILEAVETEFASPLLCDEVKAKIFASNPLEENDEIWPVDPYIVTVDRVVDYVSRRLSPKELDLVEEAAALKILGLASGGGLAVEQGLAEPKRRVLEKWLKAWDWPPAKLKRLEDYDNWPARDKNAQAQELIKLLFRCYMIIANNLMTHFPGQVDAQNEVLAPMAARMLGRFGGAEVTVERLPSHILREKLTDQFLLRREGDVWSLYERPEGSGGAAPGEGNLLYRTLRAAKAAAWLVSNQLYNPKFPVAVAESDRELVTPALLTAYLNKLVELFPPIKFHALNPQTIWLAQAQGPVLLTFNFEEPTEGRIIRSLDVIYRTGWGETRHQHKDVGDLTIEADKLFLLSQLLHESCGVASSEPLVFLAEAQPLMVRVFSNLMGAINTRFRASAPQGQVKSLIDL